MGKAWKRLTYRRKAVERKKQQEEIVDFGEIITETKTPSVISETTKIKAEKPKKIVKKKKPTKAKKKSKKTTKVKKDD